MKADQAIVRELPQRPVTGSCTATVVLPLLGSLPALRFPNSAFPDPSVCHSAAAIGRPNTMVSEWVGVWIRARPAGRAQRQQYLPL